MGPLASRALSGDERPGRGAAAALLLPASAAVMLGIVLVVNAARYGAAGVLGGCALALAGAWAGRRAFRKGAGASGGRPGA